MTLRNYNTLLNLIEEYADECMFLERSLHTSGHVPFAECDIALDKIKSLLAESLKEDD